MKDFIIPPKDWTVDMGTPASRSDVQVTLTIDGTPVTVPAGTSVMRAAAEAGITVPKLCATDHVTAFGSCRLCVVAIDGVRGTPASCTTPVADGMVVHTQTDEIARIRRGTSRLLLLCQCIDVVGVVGLVGVGGWRSCQMRRVRWRLRQRMASRVVLPSACLRAM